MLGGGAVSGWLSETVGKGRGSHYSTQSVYGHLCAASLLTQSLEAPWGSGLAETAGLPMWLPSPSDSSILPLIQP